MCGINGIYKPYLTNTIVADLKKMNNLIIHRGPDDDGFFADKENYSIAMAMRRLSIIDLKMVLSQFFKGQIK